MFRLPQDLKELPIDFLRSLTSHGFRPAELVQRGRALAEGGGGLERNRLAAVRPPSSDDVIPAPVAGTLRAAALGRRGAEAIAAGELAFCVMAGGMATRMGGVIKALVEAVDGHSFLDLRLAENARHGGSVPLWIMTSEATDDGIKTALAEVGRSDVPTFRQDLGVRLDPEGNLFRTDDGQPSTYATGHGDLVDALRRSGLLARFVSNGGRYVWIANLDNLGASIDTEILGAFAESNAGALVEVCRKKSGDRGGIPVRVPSADGTDHVEVVEEFRLPVDFDASTVDVFNTNTFLVKADALLDTEFAWNWFEVRKTVSGRPAVQFERLLQEISAHLPTKMIEVPREGAASRFLPVKDHAELASRQDELRLIAAALKSARAA
jgi:UTP--glucose-1-phosphate uridylyltransferase